jgi:hypothetical protein
MERPLASRYVVPEIWVEALPAERPVAWRYVVWELPDEFTDVVADPVVRPLASRYCVRMEPPDEMLLDVPMIRPELSRSTVWVAPPTDCLRSICFTTRPEESRTVSRQVCASATVIPKAARILRK